MKPLLHQNHLNPRKLLAYTFCSLILLALLRYYLPSHQINITLNLSSRIQSKDYLKELNAQSQTLSRCNYSTGTWVPDEKGPLYNGTCKAIKENQNCMAHGRPDTGYLYWRWRPIDCTLPRFNPMSFLELIRNRHLTFIGDSLARNQAESLVCQLASVSPSVIRKPRKRWIIRSHNATISAYFSPFLVKGIQKSEKEGILHNKIFLDSFDEKWLHKFKSMDIIVFSLGHWFRIPGIYYQNEQIIGCYMCPEFNHTKIKFEDMFRRIVRRTMEEVQRRHVEGGERKKRLVAVMTFTKPHYEGGTWDKAGTCPKKEPYKEGEVEMDYSTGELHRSVLETLDSMRADANRSRVNGLQFEAVDVTRLAILRPDGHPGPYMYPDPFANGTARDHVQNDCVHWCMPGPIDTFNEILWQQIAQSGLFS